MLAFVCFLLLNLWQSSPQERKVISASDLFKTASPSVVLIEIYGGDGKVSGSGSGFVVAADGVILTNYHVVAHTKRATVRLANGDAYDDVSVLDLDKRKDIALLKIKAIDLPPLKLGHSASVQVGDKLYALGNPLGVFQNTLSEGILSGIRQGDGYRMFQLSAPVSEGSSGSPVFDSHGDVVGIVRATVEEGQNFNLAIPIDYAVGLLGSRSPKPLESIYEPLKCRESGAGSPSEPAAAKPSDALKADAFTYLAQKINVWTKEEAEKEFGQSSARRDSLYNSTVVADIYTYSSPAPGFRIVELNFNRTSKRLVAAYFYPQTVVSWSAFKARLGRTRFEKQKGQNGAIFYSFQMQLRTLTVWVDAQENVYSIAIT